MNTTPTESEVRQLRAVVYGGDCTDHNWEIVRANWMRPDSIAWLRERAGIPLRHSQPSTLNPQHP